MADIERTDDPCECGNPSPTTPEDTYGDPAHTLAAKCVVNCDGYACTYGCGTCFCPCHD